MERKFSRREFIKISGLGIGGMASGGAALLGMLNYGEMFPLFQKFTQSGTMGRVTLSNWLHLSPGLIAFMIIITALGMFWGAEVLKKNFSEKETPGSDKEKQMKDVRCGL
ncbi:MAG: hypothetical protein ACE5GL_04330 [Calditrichia bacterium]